MGIMQRYEEACMQAEPADLDDYSGEFAINWIRGEKVATVTFPNGSKLTNRVIRMSEEYPNEVQIRYRGDDGIVAHIPVSYLRIQRPMSRELSDEQRQELRERLAKYRGLKKRSGQ